MGMRRVLAAALILFPNSLSAQESTAVTLRAAHLFDPARGLVLDDPVVVVQGGRISAVGTAAAMPAPPGSRIINLDGATLLPGLIDAHVHLTLGPADSNARATLLAGFTTVQDLGGLAHANIALRDRVAAGRTPGPRIISAGGWIGVRGGICDFDGRGVRGAEEFAARVREDVAAGADLIKICVTGWPGDALSHPDSVEAGEAEIAAVVAEARKSGRRVMAHAIGRRGIEMAVRLGAAAIVHSGFPDSVTVAEMKRRGIYLIPTLWSLTGRGASADATALGRHMRRVLAAGVPVAMGTDAGVVPHGRNARELAWLVRSGLTPLQALRAATTGAAELLGLGDSLGLVAPGRYADLIAVEGNPLDDVGRLERVGFVMKAGKVYRNDFSPSR